MPHLGEHIARDVGRDQDDLGAARGGFGRESRALPTTGAVAQEAHGVDRLPRAAGRHHDPHPGEVTGGQQRLRRGEDVLRLRHAAGSTVTAGELSVGRADDVDAALTQRGDVRLCRAIPPHLRVHRRSEQHRGLGGEQRGAQQVVGEARGDLREGVRGRGCHDHQLGGLTESHVPHLRHIIMHARGDRVPTNRLPCGQSHEAQRILGGHHGHVVPTLREQAHEVHRLVRGDAARDSDDDVHVSILPQHPPPRADTSSPT